MTPPDESPLGGDNKCQRSPADNVVPLNRRYTEDGEEVFEAEPGEGEEEASPERLHWLGPVADTVLVDFLFYGLLLAVPVLLLWASFGRWWIFRNAEWVGLGLIVWFVVVLGWRRKRQEAHEESGEDHRL